MLRKNFATTWRLTLLLLTPFLMAAERAPLPPPAKPMSGERLSMPLFPAGWHETASRRGRQEVVEYMPDGQTAADWRDKITIEVHYDLNSLPLDALQRRALAQTREGCDGVVEGRLQSGLNNGYAAGFWTLGCKRDKTSGAGEIRYTKVIQGETTLYLLSRSWRTAPYRDEGPQLPAGATEDAMAFLTTAVVCVEGSAEHPCPAQR